MYTKITMSLHSEIHSAYCNVSSTNRDMLASLSQLEAQAGFFRLSKLCLTPLIGDRHDTAKYLLCYKQNRKCCCDCTKDELLQEGIFFPHPFIYQWRFRSLRFSDKKLEIKKTKPTFIVSVLKVLLVKNWKSKKLRTPKIVVHCSYLGRPLVFNL